MADLLSEVHQFFSDLSATEAGASIEALLGEMNVLQAKLLRLAAIPHQFNTDLLRVLMPGIDYAWAQRSFEQFSLLPVVVLRGNECAIRDDSRHYLFKQWLKSENHEEFVAVSRRLAQHFEVHMQESPIGQRENCVLRHMFHCAGADLNKGFDTFTELWRQSYRQSRSNTCAALLNLIHEYDSVLETSQSLWLVNFEATLLIDAYELDSARSKLDELLASPTTRNDQHLLAETLRCKAEIESKLGNWDEAIRYLMLAIESGHNLTDIEKYMLYHAQAVAHRENGDLKNAETHFLACLKIAQNIGEPSIIAKSHNGIGTLNLKKGDFKAAIEAFNKALTALEAAAERFSLAPIYNNLGLATQRMGDLLGSLEYYSQSIDLKTSAGDTRGKAMTMNNMVPLLEKLGRRAEAINIAEQAAELFLELRDYYNTAIAKRTLARQLRRAGNDKEANARFLEAEELFLRRCQSPEMARDVHNELNSATAKTPWWIWLPIGAALACAGLLFYAIA